MHGELDSSTSSCGRSPLLLPIRMLDVASLLNQPDPSSSSSTRPPPPPLPPAGPLPPLSLRHHNFHHPAFHGFLAPPPPHLLGSDADPDPSGVSAGAPPSKPDAQLVGVPLLDGAAELSAVTNMSNITSASGEASVSSGERGTTTGHGGGMSVVQQQASAQGGASMAAAAAAASSAAGLNSNGGGLTVVVKRKRNLPGTPDPEADVIALSPKTLMATNRFVCEICNKGFQRDQNLQLHRRGHNLPWKLKQRANKEMRKKVYICPEPSCVHHDPARALGDLTGIKKHFCRKHGEKKWKCDKCSKRYAVQSDWKAHSKTCGTREYRCDCGTLFSRRDSFITHRAFCDALAEEGARMSSTGGGGGGGHGHLLGSHGNPSTSLGALGMVQGMGGAPPQSPIRAHQAAAAAAAAIAAAQTAQLGMDPQLAARCALLGPPAGGGAASSSSSAAVNPDILLHHHHHHHPHHHPHHQSSPAAAAGSINPSASRPRLSLWPSSAGNGPGTTTSSPYNHLQQAAADPSLGSMDSFAHSTSAMASLFGSLQADAADNYVDGPKPPSNYSALLMQQPSAANLAGFGGNIDISQAGALSEYAGLSNFASNRQLSTAAAMANNIGNLQSVSSFFNNNAGSANNNSGAAQMSATALLQKAAQMGATASGNSLLKGLAPAVAASPELLSWNSADAHNNRAAMAAAQNGMMSMNQSNNPNAMFQLQNRSSPSDNMHPFGGGQNRSSPSDTINPFGGGAVIRSQSLQMQAASGTKMEQEAADNASNCSAASIQEMLMSAASMASPQNAAGMMGHQGLMNSGGGGGNLSQALFGGSESQRLMGAAQQQQQQQQQQQGNGSRNKFYGGGFSATELSTHNSLNVNNNNYGNMNVSNYGKVPKSEDGITRDFLGVRAGGSQQQHHHQSAGDPQLNLMNYHHFNPHAGGGAGAGADHPSSGSSASKSAAAAAAAAAADFNQQLQRLSDFSSLYSHGSFASSPMAAPPQDHHQAAAISGHYGSSAGSLARSNNHGASSNHNGSSNNNNNNNNSNNNNNAAALAMMSSGGSSPSRRSSWDNAC